MDLDSCHHGELLVITNHPRNDHPNIAWQPGPWSDSQLFTATGPWKPATDCSLDEPTLLGRWVSWSLWYQLYVGYVAKFQPSYPCDTRKFLILASMKAKAIPANLQHHLYHLLLSQQFQPFSSNSCTPENWYLKAARLPCIGQTVFVHKYGFNCLGRIEHMEHTTWIHLETCSMYNSSCGFMCVIDWSVVITHSKNIR